MVASIVYFSNTFYKLIPMENPAELSYENLQVLSAQEVVEDVYHGMRTSREAPSFAYSAVMIPKASPTEYKDDDFHRPIPTQHRFDTQKEFANTRSVVVGRKSA
jgi:hypothetical protein